MDGRVLRETGGDNKESPQEDTGEPMFDREILTTILVKFEAVVNSRRRHNSNNVLSYSIRIPITTFPIHYP